MFKRMIYAIAPSLGAYLWKNRKALWQRFGAAKQGAQAAHVQGSPVEPGLRAA